MPAYRYAGLTLASNFSLPELPRAPARTPAVRITLGRRRARDSRHRWQQRWHQPGGRLWLRQTRIGDRHIAQFPGLCEFEIADGAIACHPRRGIPLRTVRHLLLDRILPAALASERRLVLHASAVEIAGGAVALLGRAGSGKSTLAAALALHGAPTLTDDALIVECGDAAPAAMATYPGLRLLPRSQAILGAWPAVRRQGVAHYTAKQRWSGGPVRFSGRRRELRELYVLARGTIASLERLSGRESIMALVRHSILLDVKDAAAVQKAFHLAEAVAGSVEVTRLVLPHRADALAGVCRTINARSGRR